jgi:hypothetical protein
MRALNYVVTGFLLLSCWSLSALAAIDSETENASKSMGASMASEISFEEGKANLTENAKNDIRGVIKSAKETGKIDELKVAVWADREYPAKDTKASKADIDLAKKRADSIKTFIKNEMKVGTVNTYNMTERPNALEKFLKTPQEKVKSTMEASGAAPRTSDETGFFGQKAKSSKAVIMIYIK